MDYIYLDNNATTQLAPEVIDAVTQELAQPPSNPSSVHRWGQAAKKRLQGYRETVAHYFNVKPNEVIFTSGGTEGMNFLLRGSVASNTHRHIISTNGEHACVYQTLLNLQNEGAELSLLPLGLRGAVELDQIRQAVRPDTRCICLFAVNGETGVKHDLNKIASFALKHHLPLFVDGVAWLGKEEISLHPGISGISFSGHKIHAPKGIGVTLIRSSTKLKPLLVGALQEYGLRAGTENLPGIAGFAKAIELLSTSLPQATTRMQQLRDRLETALIQLAAPAVVNGEANRICNVSNLSFPHDLGEDLLIALDLAGVAISHGSACSSGSMEPSRVLIQMGLPFSVAKSALRFSLSRYTTPEEIEKAIHITTHIINSLREKSL